MVSYGELKKAWEQWLDNPTTKTLANWKEAQANSCMEDLCSLLGYAATFITTLQGRLRRSVAAESVSKCNGSGTSKTTKAERGA